MKSTDGRLRSAEQTVVRILENRWAHHINGDQFPTKFVLQLRQHEPFREMVATYLDSGAVSLPDLEQTPRITRRVDGTVVDLMTEELGGDPNRWLCRDCRAEISPGSVRCGACQEWRETGVR